MRGRSSFLRFAWLPLCALALGVSAVLVVSNQLEKTIRAKDQERFTNASDRLQDAINGRIATYVAILRAGSGLIQVEPNLDAKQFHDFVQRLGLRQEYPGIQGVGYSRRVLAAGLPGFLAGVRAEGHRSFDVWPAGQRSEYHPVVYLEPLDRRNQAAIGYDMFTDPVRREAMDRARDSGEPAASGPVVLVQEIDEQVQPGFLIYMPVYEGVTVPSTPDERRARLRGFIYSPFRAGDLFKGIFGRGIQLRAGVTLFDNGAPDRPMYRSGVLDNPRFRVTRPLMIAGRPWTASFFSLAGFNRVSNVGMVPAVRWAGLSVTVLISILVALQTHARYRLERSEVATLQSAREARKQAFDNARLYGQVQALLESERYARAEVERVSRLKDEFLATLSHELRTPLNAIQGWAHMLTTVTLPASRVQHALATILRNAKVQAQLVDDLIDMSRITSGRVQLDVRNLHPEEVMQTAISTVKPSAEAKHLTLVLDVDPDVPVIRGDAMRLQQVFSNLLTNAIKFTPQGGRIDVRVQRDGAHVVLTVRDTGMGISPEFLPLVFDRFRQADGSIARQYGGLGLGLSIVSSLVQMHGGTVHAASEGPSTGATFTIRLPVVDSTTGQMLAVSGPRVVPGLALAPDILAGLSILTIDDDADARELLHEILVEYGARVVTVATAAEGLARLTADPFDTHLLVSDIGMPVMDGYELIRAVRRMPAERGGRIAAIALTAYAAAEDRTRVLAAGFDVHVSKPVTPHELVAACAALAHRVSS